MDGDQIPTRQTSSRSTSSPVENADRRQVGALIARLFLHYWTPQDLPNEARMAMAEDWIGDIAEFGPDIVAYACGEWRRSQSRRPTIADIRALCIPEQQARRAREPALMSPDDSMEVYAKSVGFNSAAERYAAIRRDQERLKWRDEELARDGRDRSNAWARNAGYRDFDEYLAVGGSYAAAIKEMLRQQEISRMPILPHEETRASLGGVTAREQIVDSSNPLENIVDYSN